MSGLGLEFTGTYDVVQRNFDALEALLTPIAASATTPYNLQSRAFDTTYQPSTARPTLVVATVHIACATARGLVVAKCDAASPPTTAVGQAYLRNDGASVVITYTPLTFIVPASYTYRLDTTTESGTPSFSLIGVAEMIL